MGMKMNRRNFLSKLTKLAGAIATLPVINILRERQEDETVKGLLSIRLEEVDICDMAFSTSCDIETVLSVDSIRRAREMLSLPREHIMEITLHPEQFKNLQNVLFELKDIEVDKMARRRWGHFIEGGYIMPKLNSLHDLT